MLGTASAIDICRWRHSVVLPTSSRNRHPGDGESNSPLRLFFNARLASKMQVSGTGPQPQHRAVHSPIRIQNPSLLGQRTSRKLHAHWSRLATTFERWIRHPLPCRCRPPRRQAGRSMSVGGFCTELRPRGGKCASTLLARSTTATEVRLL